MEIHLNNDRSIELSQLPFYSKLMDIQLKDVIQQDKFVLNTEKRRASSNLSSEVVSGCFELDTISYLRYVILPRTLRARVNRTKK